MKYLELAIKESLRLYPSVPLFGRKVTEETEISELNGPEYSTQNIFIMNFLDGKLLPKGSSLIIAPYFMARDPDIFENPLEFIPERFDVETTADKMNPYAYIPFSAGKQNRLTPSSPSVHENRFILGSRNCIGQKFAMLELKSTISKILRHYQVGLAIDFEPQDALELVIKSLNGVMIKISKREY